ncbi:acetylornithine/succinyldiaminopimelate transaminase [Kingella kingae]|uniref:acetylornithine/succinyldiaminopimelate transaminase n=1 Tax=Kingella kingae TaxID=504 RepID=UPI0004095369|nr:acetylornithine/succinyldiaminopimelate transaminase [Kingella kingae]MDK4566562.1 acetylornithine/succinyldiaminopimelate transaminase [Kingella kingae]MDK4590611.1 acetylornithine/succinyldiaminopimelate transaminase [Kingella kingae]MDK4628288.1 acetylornithine/succinyldiaminopimelate transaminase [Kingella kingae]MDK4636225.1 acetylornithine/succinyldiaminopimelate transaminase [Kingella kingae]MDK4638161.1 acetylornithine/succinyldiaminopimelate transaminase [Kingella kingae]
MQNYLTPNFAFAPMMPARALGSRVWSEDGKEYIDLSGGIAVNALGHCHPDLIAALTEQAQKYWHVSNYYTTQPAQQLAQKLVEHSFADKVFFANSGAEANEAALKLARKYAKDHFGADKNEIIACVNAFHGRTLFTVSVGGQPKYSEDFAPLPAGITHIPFNDVAALQAAISSKTCAVIIEPIQGESGVLPATQAFMQAARDLCIKHNAALIVDEVQTGMGRTGTLFAYEQYGITPDILSTAKALGCGIPIGAMLTTDQFAPAFSLGSHGSTFGGNPLACAVANRAFDLINAPETLAHVAAQSEKLQAALQQIAQETGVLQNVRGQGLLLGAVLAKPYENQVSGLVQAALQHGLMVLGAGGNVLRFAPSLLLSDEDLHEGMNRLRHAIAAWQTSLTA